MSFWCRWSILRTLTCLIIAGQRFPILADEYRKQTSRYAMITNYLTGTIFPALPHPFSNDASLGILTDNHRIQVARYLVIVEDLTGQISQTLQYLINLETSRRLSLFLFLLIPIYHSCPLSCQFQAARYSTIAKHLTGQTSQTLSHLISNETSRQLSTFWFLVTPIYHSCLLWSTPCQTQAARYPAIVEHLTGQASQTLSRLINHETSR